MNKLYDVASAIQGLIKMTAWYELIYRLDSIS